MNSKLSTYFEFSEADRKHFEKIIEHLDGYEFSLIDWSINKEVDMLGSDYLQFKKKAINESKYVVFLVSVDLTYEKANAGIHDRIDIALDRLEKEQLLMTLVNCRANVLLLEDGKFSKYSGFVVPGNDIPIEHEKWKHSPDKPYVEVVELIYHTGLNVLETIKKKKEIKLDSTRRDERLYLDAYRYGEELYGKGDYQKAIEVFKICRDVFFQEGFYPGRENLQKSIETLESLIELRKSIDDFFSNRISLQGLHRLALKHQ